MTGFNTNQQVKECGWCQKQSGLTINIPWTIHQKVTAMSKRMESSEWLCYITLARYTKNTNSWEVIQIDVPEQEVTGGSVDVLEPNERAFGTIHLHPMGGRFLSGIDDESIAGNHRLTLSVNKSGEYKAVVREILPCGSTILVNAEVQVTYPGVPGLDKWVEEARRKITESVLVQPAWQQPGQPKDECVSCQKKLPREESRIWTSTGWICLGCYQKRVNPPPAGGVEQVF